MCGLIAISAPPGASFDLGRSVDAIQHRGPDASGIYASERGDCHLGHVRLSILDLSDAGRQPMADATGRFILSYNGEVYNFLELRAGLEQRHGAIRWRGGSDSEVIVEGFYREGIAFLDRLNGIFALALYDREERLLCVLRDPLGVKPLSMTEQNGAVYFASEVKGLLALSGVTASLRRESFADQLAFMYVPEPHTMYREIRKVEPGVCLSYREGKQVGSHALFAHLHNPIHLASEKESVERLRSALTAAVERQLVANVPVSLFLSGGLDSSAIAHIAVRGGVTIKDAYTIAFSDVDRRLDEQSDDLHYARLMAERLGLELRVIPASQDFMALLPELIPFMEDGFTDHAAISTYIICKAAREAGVKVLLSGQGADEFLGGYRRYKAEVLLQALPATMRRALAATGRFVAPHLLWQMNAVSRRLSRFADLADQSPSSRLLGMYTWTNPETILDLLVEPAPWNGPEEFAATFDAFGDGDATDAMMKLDQHYDLMSLNLCYMDRMSMATGVEARVPFLDFDLVRLMNAMSVSLKVRRGQGKYVLKKAMEGWLPREVIYREKAGFGLPMRAWLSEGNKLVDAYLDEQRIERQGIFRAPAVRRIVDEQRRGVADHANTLFTLLCQQIWLESVLSRD